MTEVIETWSVWSVWSHERGRWLEVHIELVQSEAARRAKSYDRTMVLPAGVSPSTRL